MPKEPTILDRLDQKLVALLQRDGRITNAQLAESVGLSPSACLRRVQRLEARGVIAGYAALVDPAALGKGETVFIEVTLASQSEAALDAFERAVAASPDILECHLMAGDYDYLLRVAVADTSDYERLHRRQIAAFPSVARIRSHFAIRRVARRQDLDAVPAGERGSMA